MRRYEAMPEVKKAELIAEIAASAAAIDLHAKLRAYCRAGVREYLVCLPVEGQFDWFVFDKNVYRSNKPSKPGMLRSPFFPGLVLAVAFVAQLAAEARKQDEKTVFPFQSPANCSCSSASL